MNELEQLKAEAAEYDSYYTEKLQENVGKVKAAQARAIAIAEERRSQDYVDSIIESYTKFLNQARADVVKLRSLLKNERNYTKGSFEKALADTAHYDD